MAGLPLHYPDDEQVLALQDQFLLGSKLLVAPVLEPGAEMVRVYIPAGRWSDLWSGQKAEAGWQSWPAPIGRPAVFIQAGEPGAGIVIEGLREAGLLDEGAFR